MCEQHLVKAELDYWHFFWSSGSEPGVGPALMGLKLRNVGSHEMINEVEKKKKKKSSETQICIHLLDLTFCLIDNVKQ